MAKILLVEDDKSLREIYGVRLLAEGYDIVSAGDGEEALAMAIKEKPELIISDVMMPKISGFDMLDILRSTTETRDIKVIMMTALSSDDQRSRGEQLGADRYLVKSQVGIEDVVRTVHEILGDNGAAPAPTAAPATEAPAAEAPAVAEVPAETPVEAPVEATVEAPATDTTVASGSAPGNDSAGPLPPQPTETQPAESALPQPTAPFSSPRPANLGEEVLHPEDTTDALAGPDTAPVAPVVEPAAPAVEPLSAPETPAVDDPAVGGLNFDAAPADETVVTPVSESTPTLDTSATPLDSATTEPTSEGSDQPATPSTPTTSV